MKYSAKAPYTVQAHWQIEEVLDGDSIIISHRFSKMKKEIRLYGLDAPEIKLNRKLKADEEKSSLPAQLLMIFGMQSLEYVLTIARPKTIVTIVTEQDNYYDYWNRQLGYVILPNGKCLNEELLKSGYAKATNQYYCSKLAEYQLMNRQAQLHGLGIYSVVKVF